VVNVEMAHQDWIDAQDDPGLLFIACPDMAGIGWAWDHLLNTFVAPPAA
jgi:hypothetical protein